MYIERRLLSYVAIFIATLYYFFGRANAAMPEVPTVSGELPTVSGEGCQQTSAGKMFECKSGQSKVPVRPRP